MGPTLRVSILFPIDWINDPEKRPFLAENLNRQITGGKDGRVSARNPGAVNKVYQTSGTDRYYSAVNQQFIMAYMVRMKYHAYQPVKIKITQAQLEKEMKNIYPTGRLVSFDTFFVQSSKPSLNPYIEMEVYY